MTLSSGIVVYVLIWLVVLFLVLPWGVTLTPNVGQGFASSAPEKPFIGKKLLITCFISAGLWWIAYFIITGDYISLQK